MFMQHFLLTLRIRFKHLRQRSSRHPFIQTILAVILAGYIRFVHITSRYTIIASDEAQPYLKGDKNAIMVLWHGRLMMASPLKPKGRPLKALVSRHNDGELIARTIAALHVETIRGSSSKGGEKAARNIVRASKNGANIVITPDGPRGPHQKAQGGVIHLARLCDCPIIAFSICSTSQITLKSWDRMKVALPFGRLCAIIGPPMFIDKDSGDSEIEIARVALEKELNDITFQVDSMAAGKNKR